MAVTATHLTTASSSVDGGTYTTASVTPTSGRLYLCAVYPQGTSPVPNALVSGAGLTWTRIVSTTLGARAMQLFQGTGTPSTGTLTITAEAAGTWTGCAWQVVEFDGADLADPFVTSNTTSSRPASTATISVAFPTTVTTGNATYAAVGISVQETPAAGSGWTSLGTVTHSGPVAGFIGEFADPPQQNITASSTTASNPFVVGVEIRAASGGAPPAGTASGTVTTTGSAAGSNFPAPANLTATPVSDTQIDLSWSAVSGATGYDIERDDVVIVYGHPSTTYSDTGLPAASAHTYRVRSAT